MYRVQRRKPFPLVANVYKGTTLLTKVLGTFPVWGFLLGIGGVVKIYKKGEIMDNEQSVIEDLNEEIEELKEEVDELEEKVDDLDDSCDDLKGKVSDLEEEVHELESEKSFMIEQANKALELVRNISDMEYN